MEQIKVNTVTLKHDAESVSAYIGSLESELGKILQAKHQLDRMWDGPAAAEFKRSFETDITGLQAFIANLKRMNQYEVEAQKVYDDCEHRVNDLVTAVRV